MPPTPEPVVLCKHHDGWAAVTLNRPAVRHALDVELADELRSTLQRVADDPTIRTIVLSGAERGLSSGLDLRAAADGEPIGQALRELHRVLYELPVPLIGVLDGFAINAGAALLFACDVVVAGASSFVQVGEASRAMAIPMNAAWLRVRSDEWTSMRLAVLADRVGAAELHRLGIVAEVTSDAAVRERARSMAASIAEFPPEGPRRVKRSILDTRPLAVDDWLPPMTDLSGPIAPVRDHGRGAAT